MSTQVQNSRPAIIFDFGGVLVDWNPRYLYRKYFGDDSTAMESFLTEIGFSDWNLQQDEGRPFVEGVAELVGRFPHHAELISAYQHHWEESVAGPIQPSVDILYALKAAGYPLYGLTNWSAETFALTRQKYQFFDCFEDIVVSGAIKMIKPDPRIFQVMLDQIGRPAAECIFIDDSLVNVTAARSLGFQTIRFESSEQLQAELSARKLL